jgi:hypothetical protein
MLSHVLCPVLFHLLRSALPDLYVQREKRHQKWLLSYSAFYCYDFCEYHLEKMGKDTQT